MKNELTIIHILKIKKKKNTILIRLTEIQTPKEIKTKNSIISNIKA